MSRVAAGAALGVPCGGGKLRSEVLAGVDQTNAAVGGGGTLGSLVVQGVLGGESSTLESEARLVLGTKRGNLTVGGGELLGNYLRLR